MRLVDPFATMQYLGGTVPMHASMAAYSAYILWEVAPALKCYEGFKDTKLDGMHSKFESGINLFDDVKWMFAAHIACIVATFVRNTASPKTYKGTLARNISNGIKVWFFLYCLICVLVAVTTEDTRISEYQDREDNCPNLKANLLTLRNYRSMELVVFFSMVVGLMGYIIISKILSHCKK